MHILDQGPVIESEIDSLGHMNVRFYLGRIDRANTTLLEALGISTLATQSTSLRRYDTYSHFRREQFEGANLQVAGGVLELTATSARCYFEIRNPDKDEIAATFITVSQLINNNTQHVVPFPDSMRQPGESYGVALPNRSKPRSLTLDPPRIDITLRELDQRIPREPTPGMMSGRRETTIVADDCDDDGKLREDIDLMFILHRPVPGEQNQSFGPPVMKTPEGQRFSWAMIETRAVVLGRPHAGDRLISIGADIALGDRWRQSRRWAFIEASGELIGVNDTVGIALDLDARRSIDIPPAVRESIENGYLPDLA